MHISTGTRDVRIHCVSYKMMHARVHVPLSLTTQSEDIAYYCELPAQIFVLFSVDRRSKR